VVPCGQVRLTFKDQANDEDGFYLYRTNNSTPPSPTGAGSPYLLQTFGPSAGVSGILTHTYTPTPSGTVYYYWASAYNAVGESSLLEFAGLADTICAANLSTSDKDIVAINGDVLGFNQCGITDSLPAGTKLKLNDILKFSINLCNTGNLQASTITLTDNLLNLKQPPGGWNAKYDSGSGEVNIASVGINLSVTGSPPNQRLTFTGIPNIPAGGALPSIRRITFEGQLAIPTGYSAATGRMQNCFRADYNNGSGMTFTSACTPILPFQTGPGIPTIIEVP